MKQEIYVPKMGESIVEATIGSILKPSGSLVAEGDEILEIETDKVNQVLTAPAAGRLELSVKSGDKVKIDQSIGTILEEKGNPVEKKGEPPVPEREPKEIEKEKKREEKKEERVPIRKPVDAYLSQINEAPPVSAPIEKGEEIEKAPSSAERPESRKKMTKLRQVIGKKLVEVKNQTAMLTTFNEVDMSAVIEIREENQELFQKKHGVKLGFMSFFVKACVSALQQFPEINGRIEGDEIVYSHFYDIGVAVGTDKGLFVPVIRKADILSYAEIEKELKKYAEKGRNGTIQVDEMQGGTFTITNGGVYGSMLSTPILNPPQSAILGMHNIVKRAVVVEEQIVIRPIMYLALSYDHRIVDGKGSIGFLMHVKKNLEEPARFLLDL